MHSFFNPEKLIDPAPLSICKQFGEAIRARNLDLMEQLIRHHPALINQSLNEQGQSALLLASQYGNAAMLHLLLNNGADATHIDHTGLSALDHASFNNNEPAHQLLQERLNQIEKIAELIKNLFYAIQNSFNKTQFARTRFQILTQAILQLARFPLEKNEPAKLLDLYFTVNTVFNIVMDTKNSEELMQDKLQKFLANRETLLCGDTHDYSYNLTLANEFCYQLVKILFPHENAPTNFLLRQTLTAERNDPWQDPYLLDETLPANPGEFFRTKTNHIHLYSGIVDQAVAQLERGYSELDQVWRGTDKKNDEDPIALTKDELFLLKQRTPTFAVLINYSERLERLERDGRITLYKRLCRLRHHLMLADVDHHGSELEAGPEGFAGIASFGEWWNDLEQTADGKKKQADICAISLKRNGYTLGEIIKIILDPDYEKERGARYCLKIKGEMLEEFLKIESVKNRINEIDSSIEWRVSNQQLNVWKNQINEELANLTPKIASTSHLFAILSSSQTFIKFCAKSTGIDYHFLNPSDLKNKLGKEILFLLLKPVLVCFEKEELANFLLELIALTDFQAVKTILRMYPYLRFANDKDPILALIMKDPNPDFVLLKPHIKDYHLHIKIKDKTLFEWAVDHHSKFTEFCLTHFNQQLTDAQCAYALDHFMKNRQQAEIKQLITTRSIKTYVLSRAVIESYMDFLLAEENPDLELVKSLCNDSRFFAFVRLRSLTEKPFLFKFFIETYAQEFSEETLRTNLNYFIEQGFADHIDTIKFILTKCPNTPVNYRNAENDNLLHLACAKPDYELMHLLCQNHPHLFCQRNSAGLTPFDQAIQLQNLPIIQFFLENYIEQLDKNGMGETALAKLTYYRNYDLAKLLIQKSQIRSTKASLENGDYAIHIAVKDAEPDMDFINLLCQHKNNLLVKNQQGKLPLQVATKEEVSELLFEKMMNELPKDKLAEVYVDLIKNHDLYLANQLLKVHPDISLDHYFRTIGKENDELLLQLNQLSYIALVAQAKKESERGKPRSLLYWAAEFKHEKIMLSLLNNHFEKFNNECCCQALEKLVATKQIQLAKLLIAKKPNLIKSSWHHRTDLHHHLYKLLVKEKLIERHHHMLSANLHSMFNKFKKKKHAESAKKEEPYLPSGYIYDPW